MAKKSKDARSYVKMQSSESHHCYSRSGTAAICRAGSSCKKYDPIVRKHVMYKEGKM